MAKLLAKIIGMVKTPASRKELRVGGALVEVIKIENDRIICRFLEPFKMNTSLPLEIDGKLVGDIMMKRETL